ncbi:MAG TPA: hypothetical protein VKU39_13830 [Streptosporangiaceae bacterium]|nr:hypothetical protein [Streptosporangiaceae bacterium]
MDLGPPLPPRELAVALAALRIRNAAARAGAIFRVHPAGSTVPVLVLSAVVAVFVMTSVSVRIVTTPQAAGHGPGDGLLPSPSPIGGGQQAQPVAVRRTPGHPASAPGSTQGSHGPATWPGAPEPTSSAGTGGNPLSSIAATSPPPSAPPATAPALPSAAPSTVPPAPPSPSPQPTVSTHGTCITIGPIQICL